MHAKFQPDEWRGALVSEPHNLNSAVPCQISVEFGIEQHTTGLMSCAKFPRSVKRDGYRTEPQVLQNRSNLKFLTTQRWQNAPIQIPAHQTTGSLSHVTSPLISERVGMGAPKFPNSVKFAVSVPVQLRRHGGLIRVKLGVEEHVS